MATKLTSATKPIVDKLFGVNSADEKRKLLDQIPKLADQDKVNLQKYLSERLPTERDKWNRAWSLSALAATTLPGVAEQIAAYLDAKKEPFAWARYWAVVSLGRLNPPDLKDHLDKSKFDEDGRVTGISFRLLIEKGYDDDDYV